MDRLDINKLYKNNGEMSTEDYYPKIMLATWFLAYAESVHTTNELEYSCRKNLGIQSIQIPNCYAKYFDLQIISDDIILKSIQVYDDKGLFESFEFSNIKLNVSFHPDEFARDFPEYEFW